MCGADGASDRNWTVADDVNVVVWHVATVKYGARRVLGVVSCLDDAVTHSGGNASVFWCI